MVAHRIVHLGLSLLIAAGLGVCGSGVAGQGATSKAPSSKKSTSSTSGKTRKTSKKTSRKKDKGQQAPTPDRITEIQQALSKTGSFGGTPNGKWDDSTVEAMKNFQTTHRLNPTGKLDALTLQKLGLGSQTAGVGAPTPPPNATSRLTSSIAEPSRQ
jgi:peptidoglycan hydrolase-like protein with peptidoglycan-binding domain